MKKTLLHVCCGPCSIYPVKSLREQGYQLTGYFYNPNIHPYREFSKRLATLETYAEKADLELIAEREYGLTEFVRKVAFKESSRCTICYQTRLEETARKTAEIGFDSFTTTLLYSTYQNHEQLKNICQSLAKRYQLEFVYQDFRVGWQEGIDLSKEMSLYRQPYCGCLYSEQERYDKSRKTSVLGSANVMPPWSKKNL